MTAFDALFVSPVVGALLGDGVIAGMGDLDLTCTTCGGKGEAMHELYDNVRCPDCTKGRIVSVSQHYLIVFDGAIRLHAHVEWLPIVSRRDHNGHIGAHACISGLNEPGDTSPMWWFESDSSGPVDISGAPGVWKPGGWAARFTEITTTIPCPWPGCDGGSVYEGHDGTQMHYVDCKVCDGSGSLALPIPWGSAPDRPCIGTINPAEVSS